MKRKYFGLVIVGLVALALATSGCSKKKQAEEQASVSKPEGAADRHVGNLSGKIVNGFREIEIEAFKFGFKPDTIVVKKGEKVRLIAKSTDVIHGIEIEKYNINQELPPNEIKVIEFTANKTGQFHFHCSVYCGSGHGKMHGKLIVIE